MVLGNLFKRQFLVAFRQHAKNFVCGPCDTRALSASSVGNASPRGGNSGEFSANTGGQTLRSLERNILELGPSFAAVPSLSRPFQSHSAQRMMPDLQEKDTQAVERNKLLVIGGNGFVGSHICAEAVAQGIPVASLNRSGPPQLAEPWVSRVEWIRGSVTDTGIWKEKLRDVMGVVSCLGAFGSNKHMVEVNGEANVQAVNLAAEQGVPRFVYISAHDFGFPSFVLKGYFEGKRMAEEAVRAKFPYGGVILRPGMIHGTRRVGSVSLPLSLIGAPAEMILKQGSNLWGNVPLIGRLLVPPVKVTAVAKTAIRAATDSAVPSGILDVPVIDRLGA